MKLTEVFTLVQNTKVDLMNASKGQMVEKSRRPNSSPRTPPDGLRHYNHLAPIGHDGLVNLPGLVRTKPNRIPRRMSLDFRPTQDMDIGGVELAVAIYIFSNDIGNREALMSLKLRGEVVHDVVDVLATMLANSTPSFQWFLPTSVMVNLGRKRTLRGPRLSPGNVAAIKRVHMCSKVDMATKIYLPMWCPRHWYLMIVDVGRERLVYLDSYRIEADVESKKLHMIDVLSSDDAERPRFSAYKIELPEVPQQHRESNDCGVWMAEWMMREAMWYNHGVEVVGAETRMKLATDLVLKPHKKMAKDIVEKAFAHWRSKEEASQPLRRAL
ncbi:hypothetical protein PIB30_050705 [Stylosanthes scabra]|uniref:Ubiquitin-like protease family profile domain-containing protein n=1 Tax=Stylosanthes scabra TaxID=79078 RepID=A0ABU6UGE0_9FABA|nr:hypothetical protein [Stylosanthes scabra]